MTSIKPSNLSAQLAYRGRGNPPNAHPGSAISNCFPGLEFDFRTIWRRMFVGIELSEHNNYVIAAEPQHGALQGTRLMLIDDGTHELATGVVTTGPVMPGYPPGPISNGGSPNGVSFMEWSNSLARIFASQGQTVRLWFTDEPAEDEILPPADRAGLRSAEFAVRRITERSVHDGMATVTIAAALLEPGELSEGLCSPWQNDYRECACYYWAASRPDYVNVDSGTDGASRGDNWMQKDSTGSYLPDDRQDPRLWSYDDLFRDWQAHLKFIIGGTDAQDAREREPEAPGS